MCVKVRYTIMPEFAGAYGWINREPEVGSDYLGPNHACYSGGWGGDHPISRELEEDFAQWQVIFERGHIEHDDWIVCIDWDAFHKRGLELAVRLKAELGDEVDVLYRKPIEDPNFRHKGRYRVLRNGGLEEAPTIQDQLFFENKLPLWFPHKIISGGQTGVDRGALDFACEIRLPHGGWCPKGRLACDGPIPAKFQLKETESTGYRQRTKRNVQDSDATFIINAGLLEGGTELTLELAKKFGKPSLLVQVDETTVEENTKKISDWLRDQNIKILNVAGPREIKRPAIFEQTRALLWALSRVDRCDDMNLPTRLFRPTRGYTF